MYINAKSQYFMKGLRFMIRMPLNIIDIIIINIIVVISIINVRLKNKNNKCMICPNNKYCNKY